MRVPASLFERPSGSRNPGDPPAEPRQGAASERNVLFEHRDPSHALGKRKIQRIRVDLSNDDNLYLHGFSEIPQDQEPASSPFMLEEKGIEEKDFACAVDIGEVRVYLTRLQAVSTNVSKNGVLLLNKQDSMRWRGVHESILNDLRVHGTLVPFEFGTVALGLDDLRTKVQVHHHELVDAHETMQATTWWNLSVLALDSRMAQLVASEGAPAGRRQEMARPSYAQQTQGVKFDIKTLERILSKQKKIAETIHEELNLIADRSDIDQMIGLGSGTTDDWKTILKASYEVPPSRLQRFHSAVSESQYRHMLFEIMLSMAGNVESFTFRDDGSG